MKSVGKNKSLPTLGVVRSNVPQPLLTPGQVLETKFETSVVREKPTHAPKHGIPKLHGIKIVIQILAFTLRKKQCKIVSQQHNEVVPENKKTKNWPLIFCGLGLVDKARGKNNLDRKKLKGTRMCATGPHKISPLKIQHAPNCRRKDCSLLCVGHLKGWGAGKGRGGGVFRTQLRGMMSALWVQRGIGLLDGSAATPFLSAEYRNVHNICATVRWLCEGAEGHRIVIPRAM